MLGLIVWILFFLGAVIFVVGSAVIGIAVHKRDNEMANMGAALAAVGVIMSLLLIARSYDGHHSSQNAKDAAAERSRIDKQQHVIDVRYGLTPKDFIRPNRVSRLFGDDPDAFSLHVGHAVKQCRTYDDPTRIYCQPPGQENTYVELPRKPR